MLCRGPLSADSVVHSCLAVLADAVSYTHLRAEVRDRLDQTEIHAEGILDERFAVAGDRRGHDMYAVAAQLVQLGDVYKRQACGSTDDRQRDKA